MFRNTFLTPLLAASALSLAIATPAQAGKEDRARTAIAAAEAKIQTAETMGAGIEVPRQVAEARASLARAKEALAADHNADSISQAITAQSLADTAIGTMQRDKEQALSSAEQMRAHDVANANQQAASAQTQAVEANARAQAAERSAATSAAEASAARSALTAQQQAQVETTVTTQQPAARTTTTRRAAPKTVTRTVRRTSAATPATPATTTTTTIRQSVNP
jgi:hypothetical protein